MREVKVKKGSVKSLVTEELQNTPVKPVDTITFESLTKETIKSTLREKPIQDESSTDADNKSE